MLQSMSILIPIPVQRAVRSLVAMKSTHHPPHQLHMTQIQASGPSSTFSAHWRRRNGFRRMICRRRNKLGKWGVLTSIFRGEEHLFRRNRGRDDVKLVEKVSKASSFAIIGQVQVELC